MSIFTISRYIQLPHLAYLILIFTFLATIQPPDADELSPHTWHLRTALAMLPCPTSPCKSLCMCKYTQSKRRRSQTASHSVRCPLIEQRHQVRARCRSFTYYSLSRPARPTNPQGIHLFSCRVTTYTLLMYIHMYIQIGRPVSDRARSPLNVTKRNITAPYYRANKNAGQRQRSRSPIMISDDHRQFFT